VSRRSHRHGDRGHGRPLRLEPGHAAHPSPPPAPVEAPGTPDRPASVIVAPPTSPSGDVAQARSDERPDERPDQPGDRAQPAMTNGHGPTPTALIPGMPGGPHPPQNGGPIADGAVGSDQMRSAGCTSPQLRRFIKSRAYIPMHELRRRFAINGPEDDVAAIDIDGTRLYVGLPEREGRLLAELLRGGDVGAELSHDPVTPIIVGVYPMRPVPRS
jgi:hypothetical protein